MPNFNSDHITNITASPPVKNPIGQSGGRKRYKKAEYETLTTQIDGDTLRMFRVKSNDVITSLLLTNDALTGMIDVNFGLYDIGDSGSAVDDNLFDDAQTLATALVRQEKRVGANSAFTTGETLGDMVWELLALSEDPILEYDVVLTLVDSGVAAGTIVLEMDYIAGS